MQLNVNGIRYFIKIHQNDVELSGHRRKPQLLLLHGFMGSGRVFETLIASLKAFCNPITIDLLGHGKTDKANSPARYHTKKQIEDLETIISKISNGKIYLHGYSMGGRLAMHYALTNYDTLKGLILESTHYGLKDKQKKLQRKKADEERARQIENNFNLFLDNWSKMPLFKSKNIVNKKLKRYNEIQRKQNPQQMAYSLRGFGAGQMPSKKQQLHKLNIPVLLMAGDQDKKYVRIANEMHAIIPSNRLAAIPKAAHRIHLDQPKAFVNEVKRFIHSV